MTPNAPARGMRQLAGTTRVSQIRIISAAIAIVLPLTGMINIHTTEGGQGIDSSSPSGTALKTRQGIRSMQIAIFSAFTLILSAAILPVTNGAEAITHSFFVAGPTFTGIIAEDGSEEWNADKAGARDGFILPNGNALIAWGDEVKELTREKQVVFRYAKSSDNSEIGTAQRLNNGHTLITELGKKPRLLEVDVNGKIVVDVPLQPETDNAHMQTRMARKLANGNYLAPHLLAFRVKEYSPDGQVVKQFATDMEDLGGRAAENWPFTAIRLENGHTLINLTHGNKTVEMDVDGKVVWKVGNEDFPELKPFDDPCGGQRLPNGNTVICSYHAEQGIKVFEVTHEKKIVWTYTGPHRAHEIQILTTNGRPLEGLPLK